jgi:hypothetical protein
MLTLNLTIAARIQAQWPWTLWNVALLGQAIDAKGEALSSNGVQNGNGEAVGFLSLCLSN